MGDGVGDGVGVGVGVAVGVGVGVTVINCWTSLNCMSALRTPMPITASRAWIEWVPSARLALIFIVASKFPELSTWIVPFGAS